MLIKFEVQVELPIILGFLPIFAACSSDDDNSAAELTSDEIIQLLKGSWEVSGELKYNYNGDFFTDYYQGVIKFEDNRYITFRVKEGNHYTNSSYYLEEMIVDDYYKFNILKKGGNNYITFGRNSYPFKIASLKANSFKLILDETYDYENGNKQLRMYMTMYSK